MKQKLTELKTETHKSLYKLEIQHHFPFFKRFYLFLVFFKKILFVFRQRGGEDEREGDISVWLRLWQPASQARALSWEVNLRLSGSQACAQSTGPHQLCIYFWNEEKEGRKMEKS